MRTSGTNRRRGWFRRAAAALALTFVSAAALPTVDAGPAAAASEEEPIEKTAEGTATEVTPERCFEPVDEHPFSIKQQEAVDPEDLRSFVSGWTQHLSESQPLDVRPEGLEKLEERFTEGQQRHLVVELINHWCATLDGFRKTMEEEVVIARDRLAAGKVEEAGELEPLRWTYDLLAELFFSVAFTRERLEGALQELIEQPPLPAAPLPEPLVDPIPAALIPPAPTELLPPPAPNGAPPPHQQAVNKVVGFVNDPIPTVQDALRTPLAVPRLPEVPTEVLSQIPPVVAIARPPALQSLAVSLDPNRPLRFASVLVDSSVYVGCVRDRVNPGEWCGPTKLVGSPVDFDLDNDPGTGNQLGHDLRIHLKPPTTDATSVKFEATVSRLGDDPAPFVGEAYLRYRVPNTNGELTLGFSGDGTQIPRTESASLTITNPAAAAGGNLDLSAAITHDAAAGSTIRLLAGWKPLTASEDDGVMGTVIVENAPAALTARLKSTPASGQQPASVTTGVTAATSPRVSFVAYQGRINRFTGLVDRLPASADLTFTTNVAGDLVTKYVASAPISKIGLTGYVRPDLTKPISVEGALTIQGVPAWIEVTSGRGAVSYRGADVLTSATATAQVLDHNRPITDEAVAGGLVRVSGVPARWSVTNPAGSTKLVWDSSTGIGSVEASFFEKTADIQAAVRIEGLPKHLEASLEPGKVVVTTDEGIDRITAAFRQASPGVPALAGDHAAYGQTATQRSASLDFSGFKGLQLLRSSTGDVVVDLERTHSTPFAAQYSDPAVFAMATVSNVPTHVRLELANKRVVYDAFGQVIDEINVQVNDRRGNNVDLTVRGIPARIEVLPDADARKIVYSATRPVDEITLSFVHWDWDGFVKVASIPTAWTIDYSGTGLLFETVAPGIGVVEATVTNHDWSHRFDGDHAAVSIWDGGEIDASVRVSALKRIEVRPGDTAKFDIDLCGAQPFFVWGEHRASNNVIARANATLSPFPAKVSATFGRTANVVASHNIDLRAQLQWGTQRAIDAVGPLTLTHGFIARDAVVAVPNSTAKERAIKADLYLTGLPTSFSAADSVVEVKNIKPKIDHLRIDVELDDVVPEPLSLVSTLRGIPNPLDIKVSTWSQPVLGGGSVSTTAIETNKALAPGSANAFEARFSKGKLGGHVTISNLPANLTVDVRDLPGDTRVIWSSQTETIRKIFAGVRAESAVGFATATLRGTATLTDVPIGQGELRVQRDANGLGPRIDLSSRTSTALAAGLDVVVAADGSLTDATSQLSGSLYFRITNLGPTFTTKVSNGVIDLVSPGGAIGEIEARVSARYDKTVKGSGYIVDTRVIDLDYAYTARLAPKIENFTLRVKDLKQLTIRPGLATKVSGEFSDFRLGWDRAAADVSLSGHIGVYVDWPYPLADTYGRAIAVDTGTFTLQFIVPVERYWATSLPWTPISLNVRNCTVRAGTTLEPGRAGIAWPQSAERIHLGNPDANVGEAFYLTPNPFGAVPAPLMDLATYASADSKSVGAELGMTCRV